MLWRRSQKRIVRASHSWDSGGAGRCERKVRLTLVSLQDRISDKSCNRDRRICGNWPLKQKSRFCQKAARELNRERRATVALNSATVGLDDCLRVIEMGWLPDLWSHNSTRCNWQGLGWTIVIEHQSSEVQSATFLHFLQTCPNKKGSWEHSAEKNGLEGGSKSWLAEEHIVLEKMLAKHSSGRSENIFFLGAHFKNAREPGCERVVLVDKWGRG